MSTCELIDFNTNPSSSLESLEKRRLINVHNYRKKFSSNVEAIMQNFENLAIAEESFVPEFFHNDQNGTTCIFFFGDKGDVDRFEEYIRTRE